MNYKYIKNFMRIILYYLDFYIDRYFERKLQLMLILRNEIYSDIVYL